MHLPRFRTRLPQGAGRLLVVVFGVIIAAGLCLEGLVRASGYQLPRWYPQVAEEQAWRAARDRVVFVGTSRTFAAVDEERFTAGNGVSAVNMGQGFSTITTHALGLRYLADRGALAGTTVMVEAPDGLADPATWRDPWLFAERPQWLLSVMRVSDVPALWRSETPIEDSLAVTFRGLAVGSRLATYREDVRVTALGWVYDRVRGGAPVGDDIVLPARRNPGDSARIREAAMRDGQRWLAGTRPVDWNTTVVATLVETVQAAGGRVVFLTLPLSEAMSAGLRTPIAQANRQGFDDALARWGTTRLQVPVTFTEDDFPDLWHLGRSGRDRFTTALIDVWSAGDRR